MTTIKIISGGQTGVDRAALDVATHLSLLRGGWCPQGRKAEDGRISDLYLLKETPSPEYSERTEWNVRDSEGTLILSPGELTGGTLLTHEIAIRLKKPVIVLEPELRNTDRAIQWMKKHNIHILNVAGPRESNLPGIYQRAYEFLLSLNLTG